MQTQQNPSIILATRVSLSSGCDALQRWYLYEYVCLGFDYKSSDEDDS